MIVGSVDIGSNTVRLLIADINNGAIDKVLYEERFITRLAENINNTGKLSIEAIERTMNALSSFDRSMGEYPIEKVKAVATSAVREASNKDDLLKRVEELSYNIDVIDGNLESHLTFIGVSSGIDLKGSSSLLVDIGGGSTEFVFHDGENIVSSESIRYGAVKLAEMFDVSDVVTDATLDEMLILLDDKILPCIENKYVINQILATAGTATTLAAISLKMSVYDADKVNGLQISYDETLDIFKKLCELDMAERREIVGLEKGREDLIIPGVFILLYILGKLHMKEMIICDNGLREGVAIAAAS